MDLVRAVDEAVIEEFEQVVAFARSDGIDCKIVDDDEINFGDGGEALAEAAIGVTEAQLLEEARGTHVPGGEPGATGLLRQRTGEVGLAGAAGAVDQQVLALADPLAGGEAGEPCAVQAGASAVVDVF